MFFVLRWCCVSAILALVLGQQVVPPAPKTPPPTEFHKKPPNRQLKTDLANWLLNGNYSTSFVPNPNTEEYEYSGFDGWYNNIARPDLGAIDRPLLRRTPAVYEDGTYIPVTSNRPNPFDLSDGLLAGESGTTSFNGKNALLVFFGQQVVEEILDAQRPACPPEYFNIKIPETHKYRRMQGNHTEMPILRTRYDQRTGLNPNNPRQQLNEITPYIDGGLFYGITKQWSDQLRTYKNGSKNPDGCLATSADDGLFPEYNIDRLPMANPPPPFHHATYIKDHETANVNRFFKLGNPRGNENPFLLSFGIMWFRWHNYLAKGLRRHHKDWSSEKVFNEARKWTIATQQKIYLYDWLESWVGERLPNYVKYDPNIDPQIDQFFQSAAFRFGHTLVVPGVYLRGYLNEECPSKFNSWGSNTIRTCNSFWRSKDPILTKVNQNESRVLDIDRILMGMSVQHCEKEDNKIVEDLRGNVFGPLEFPRRDLMAINIQRARDHGLPDFNTARKAFNIRPITDFDYFAPFITKPLADKMKSLYDNHVNKIDVWVGGICETTQTGPGILFRTIILDQFRRIRDGDRFWFENRENKLFTEAEIGRIKNVSLYDILMAVTNMSEHDIPKNPFRVPTQASDPELIQGCKLTNINTSVFFSLPPVKDEVLNEPCTQGASYDYFSNSEVSYILTFISIGTFIIGTIGVAFLLIRLKEHHIQLHKEQTRNTMKPEKNLNYPFHCVDEWSANKKSGKRVVLILNQDLKQISLNDEKGETLRALDFKTNQEIVVYTIANEPYVIIKCKNNYDLVVKFDSFYLRDTYFKKDLETFITNCGLQRQLVTNFNFKAALKIIVTKEDRQSLLEMFFRVVFAQTFKIKHDKSEMLKIDADIAKEIVDTELTMNEFAEALSMRASNEFVKRIFELVDKDRNGFISFREFIDLLIMFADGTEENKAQFLFDMYDINGTGYLTFNDFITMIKSFLETVNANVDQQNIEKTINFMMKKAGVDHKTNLYFQDFKKMIGTDIQNLNDAKLGFKGVKKADRLSYLQVAKNTIEDIYGTREDIEARFQGVKSVSRESEIIDENQEVTIEENKKFTKIHRSNILKFIELKSKEIFWVTLYTLVLFAIFAERAYYYSVEREHSGLRKIAGYGVTITRGAASAMMFTYSSLLVTMCRNTITYLRDTITNQYFPFDSSIFFHKYIASWAFIFTVIHIIGHASNFYHISTQTADDLTCLFRNYFHATHVIPKFHYWCWLTMTGFTGIILTLIWAVMYIFAQHIVRSKIYNWFWYTHNLYPLFYIFMILHGTGRLIQPPFTYYFLLGPMILFTIDSLISISRKRVEIPLIKADILPSGVTMLEFPKPDNFQFKAGQWVRIACLKLNKNEYHPFTISSAPDETNLTVHIRAVGPWTRLIRTIAASPSKLPKIYLDGPYGEAHQDWSSYDISILIGGGIGVTPFASILKDVSYSLTQKKRCKKVFFIWVSRTQKQFEWLVDIIRDVEQKDTNNFVSCHIFITQFYEKFDLRTILLYICERHYQRVANKSLFTNLKAVTHFGRPVFSQFFKTVQTIYDSSKRVGVFSCGPPSMTSSVESACRAINQQSDQRFEHHFKNF